MWIPYLEIQLLFVYFNTKCFLPCFMVFGCMVFVWLLCLCLLKCALVLWTLDSKFCISVVEGPLVYALGLLPYPLGSLPYIGLPYIGPGIIGITAPP